MRCIEVSLVAPSAHLHLIDGATGQRAEAKQSRYLAPGMLKDMGRTLDDYFTPSEFLDAREYATS